MELKKKMGDLQILRPFGPSIVKLSIPNYLMHTVYPFSDTDEERRSISFNAQIDKDSANYAS